jgi:hypothetical protein
VATQDVFIIVTSCMSVCRNGPLICEIRIWWEVLRWEAIGSDNHDKIGSSMVHNDDRIDACSTGGELTVHRYPAAMSLHVYVVASPTSLATPQALLELLVAF